MDEISSAARRMSDRDYFDLFQKDERYRKYLTRWITVDCNYLFEVTFEKCIRNCQEYAYVEWLQKNTADKNTSDCQQISEREARIQLEALRRVSHIKWGEIIMGVRPHDMGIDEEVCLEVIRLKSSM